VRRSSSSISCSISCSIYCVQRTGLQCRSIRHIAVSTQAHMAHGGNACTCCACQCMLVFNRACINHSPQPVCSQGICMRQHPHQEALRGSVHLPVLLLCMQARFGRTSLADLYLPVALHAHQRCVKQDLHSFCCCYACRLALGAPLWLTCTCGPWILFTRCSPTPSLCWR
jgi:hypothetical protein